MDMVADLRAKGEKVLALSAGEPDFDTPAPIKEAVIKALEENYTHYGSNRGYPALRKLLSEKLEKRQGFPMIRRQRSFSPPAVQKP